MIFKGKAESVKLQGDAIIKIAENTFFVPFVWKNEEVSFTKISSQRGRLEKILTPSQDRIPPLCCYFTKCGGCKFQHIKYDVYLNFKKQMFMQTLKQRGIINIPNLNIIGIPHGTRRRATFNSISVGASHWFGFNTEKSKAVISIKNCLLLTKDLSDLILPLKKIAKDISGDFSVTQLINGFDILITANKYPNFSFLENLADFSKQYKILRWTYRSEETSSPEPILQIDKPKINFAGVDVDFPAGAFLQPSREGQEILTNLILKALNDYDDILDLFCGLGCFTIPLALQKNSRKVLGYDIYKPAILELLKTKITNLKAETKNLYENNLDLSYLNKFSAVLLDPPRAGALLISEQLAISKITKIVYVSCNPATFARDAKILLNAGYNLQKINLVDQFVFSPHLEVVAEFVRE